MKQLEIDALALAGTRARLQAAEERILSLALVSTLERAQRAPLTAHAQLGKLFQLYDLDSSANTRTSRPRRSRPPRCARRCPRPRRAGSSRSRAPTAGSSSRLPSGTNATATRRLSVCRPRATRSPRPAASWPRRTASAASRAASSRAGGRPRPRLEPLGRGPEAFRSIIIVDPSAARLYSM